MSYVEKNSSKFKACQLLVIMYPGLKTLRFKEITPTIVRQILFNHCPHWILNTVLIGLGGDTFWDRVYVALEAQRNSAY
jgi:hypothetical protein